MEGLVLNFVEILVEIQDMVFFQDMEIFLDIDFSQDFEANITHSIKENHGSKKIIISTSI